MTAKPPDKQDDLEARKARVRRDFETTDLPLRALADLHGIKSENQIRRWRDREGWQRDVAAITAGLVTRAVAIGRDLDPPDAPAPPPRGDVWVGPVPPGFVQIPVAPPPGADAHLAPPATTPAKARERRMSRKTAHLVSSVPEHAAREGMCADLRTGECVDFVEVAPLGATSAHTPDDGAHTKRAKRARVIAPAVEDGEAHSSVAYRKALARAAEDRMAVDTAKGLADVHAKAIRKQVAVGDTMISMALAINANIQLLMDPDANVEDMGWALRRLTCVNGDRETLAGLMDKVASTIAKAVAIQRKALGMDLRLESPDRAAGPADVATLLKDIPPEKLAILRDLMAMASKTRPDAVPVESARAKARGSLMPPLETEPATKGA